MPLVNPHPDSASGVLKKQRWIVLFSTSSNSTLQIKTQSPTITYPAKTTSSKAQSPLYTRSNPLLSPGSGPPRSSLTVDQEMPESKAEKIERVKANLPLPEQPPAASDLKSANMKTTSSEGVSAGDVSTGAGVTSGLREPATKAPNDIDMSGIGRQGKDGLNEPPKDARS
ncbi:uncharacterized protein P884DRAFT_258987 [Thermothelomyces heterothallicus CBS 202.75]|uniref:uncharacterized protein n=1 Tax=Thermothelomyces heterothallicus CBS 202.75 TaxID=1149848 RepID=UPI0037443FFE